MKLLPSDLQSCILKEGWESGYSTVMPDLIYKAFTSSDGAEEQLLGLGLVVYTIDCSPEK